MKSLVFTLFLAIGTITLSAQGTPPTCNPFPKTINVSGSAEMEVVPDEIFAQVTLQEYKKKGAEKKEIQQIRTEFLAACKSVGIPDSLISVLSFGGQSSNLMIRKRKEHPDMIATLSYVIKFSKAAKMDELVNKMDDEATNNFSVISTSHSKATEFRRQLKIDAIKSAKNKAAYLCEAVGEQVGQAISITEPVEGTLVERFQTRAAVSSQVANSFANTTYGGFEHSDGGIDFRKIKYRFEVQVVFAIR